MYLNITTYGNYARFKTCFVISCVVVPNWNPDLCITLCGELCDVVVYCRSILAILSGEDLKRPGNHDFVRLPVTQLWTIWVNKPQQSEEHNMIAARRINFIRPFEKRTYHAVPMSVRLSSRPFVSVFGTFFNMLSDIDLTGSVMQDAFWTSTS